MPLTNKSLKEIAHRQQKKSRLILSVMSAIAGYLLLSFFFGEMGFSHFSTMKQALAKAQQEVEALEAGNELLLHQIEGFRTDSFYVETIARERLGLVKPGEIVYEFYSP